MASKREAGRLGYDTGYGIAAENFGELFEEYDEPVEVGSEGDFVAFAASKVAEIESEHFRQFSPFEMTAQDFNRSRDLEAVWEAYERGVVRGAEDAVRRGLKACDRVYALP